MKEFKPGTGLNLNCTALGQVISDEEHHREACRRARLVVIHQARDNVDCALLLDVLGLSGLDGGTSG